MKIFKGIDPVLAVWLVLMILACVALELISPTPKEELEEELSRQQSEVIEVQSPPPVYDMETVTVTDDLDAEIQARIDSGYYDALDLLARLIHCENGEAVDGEEACWYTGSVVINRINNPRYPNTVEGVVYDTGQYDCLDKLYRETPSDIEYEVAAELLSSGSAIPENVLYAAEFLQGSGEYDSKGQTIYCYE